MGRLKIEDVRKTVFEPIEFEYRGKVFSLDRIDEEELQKLTVWGSTPDDGDEDNSRPMQRQLADLFGCEMAELDGLDAREIRAVFRYVTLTAEEQIKTASNPTTGKRKESRS